MTYAFDAPGQSDRPAYAHIDWSKTPDVPATLPALLSWGLAHCAARDLIVDDGDRISYAEAAAQSAVLARHLLAYGVGKDSRVGILLPNGREFVVTWLAIVRIGAVAVPVSTLSSGLELARIARLAGFPLLISTDSDSRTNFAGRIEEAFGNASADSQAPAAAPHLRTIWIWHGEDGARTPAPGSATTVPEALLTAAEETVRPADPISIIFTSGSTSDPKGVIHSHGTFLRSSKRWAASMPFRDAERLFATLPMFWVGGLVINLLTVMQVGGTIVTSAGSTTKVLDMIERERCTSMQTFPMLGRKLVEDPTFRDRDLSAMRAGSVQAMIAPAHRSEGRAPFAFAMGMSETAGSHTMAMQTIDAAHTGAMGLLGGGMEHCIVDPETGAVLPEGVRGVLHLRGNTLMLGYVGRERSDTFDRDGWFDTGDICTIRGDFLYFHGRNNAMIKTAGANVAPAEVEAALLTIDGVAEAHVVGLPDEERGEIVGAIVLPRCGHILTEQSVLAEARRQLSSYKVPRRLIIADAVPLTGTNKLDRRAAAKLLQEAEPV